MSFHPYLNFGGNCRDAFTRYQEIFGGELTLLAMSDVPGPGGGDAGQPDLIMHAALRVGDELLMASDSQPGPFGPVQYMYVYFATDDPTESKRVFDALADGGTIEVPFGETFFSPAFGVCKDRFGTPWMVNTWSPEG